MRPKVILNQIRTFNDLCDDTTLYLKQNWKPLLNAYLYICGYPLLALFAVYGFEQAQSIFHLRWGDYMFGLTYICRIGLSVVNVMLLNLTVLCYMLLYRENEQRVPEKSDVYHYVKYYFVRVLIGNLILWLGLAVAFVAGFLPGVYFLPIVLLITTIMVMENGDLGYAFSRAFQLIKNNWWQTAGAIFMNILLIWSISVLFLMPVTLLSGTITVLAGIPFKSVFEVVLYISFLALQFTYALLPILMVLVYFNLHERHGDSHLLQRIEMLGRKQVKVDHLQAEDY